MTTGMMLPIVENIDRAGVSDDEAILRFFAGEDYVARMKAAGPPRERAGAKSPLVTLIEQAIKQKHSRQVYFNDGNVTLRMEKRKEHQNSC